MGAECEGREGYDDISVGAPVTVTNESGTTIATARLSQGEIVDTYRASVITCEWSFAIEDVPDAEFYDIEVSHRGTLTYSREEMEKMEWEVAFELGG